LLVDDTFTSRSADCAAAAAAALLLPLLLLSGMRLLVWCCL